MTDKPDIEALLATLDGFLTGSVAAEDVDHEFIVAVSHLHHCRDAIRHLSRPVDVDTGGKIILDTVNSYYGGNAYDDSPTGDWDGLPEHDKGAYREAFQAIASHIGQQPAGKVRYVRNFDPDDASNKLWPSGTPFHDQGDMWLVWANLGDLNMYGEDWTNGDPAQPQEPST